MTIYDISGNEITGKEVVFERYVNTILESFDEPKIKPFNFENITCISDCPHNYVFLCQYKDRDDISYIYLGHLKDKE